MQIEKPKLAFKGKLTPIKKVTKVVCHHPDHTSWGIIDIHNYHRNSKGWAGIGYNYFITFDGRIQEGRGKNVGAHCSGRNSDTLGVCFQGDFDKQHMTDAQVKAGGWLIAKLIKEHGLQINDVLGHRDLAATACPGKNFRMADLKAEILKNLNPKTVVKPNEKKEVSWLMEPVKFSVKEMENALLRVLNRFEQKDPALGKEWRTKFINGELTGADALGLLYVAVDRGYITGKSE
ncbi:peptidoglycan recognition family protein [Robertmurraya sp. DFI.2.37]|uniref:peptidoglycan recognition protein family protein n=1 Tax=Robertmurraya sp. DFI.2.37 TaxID=3031819 RepID=UPI0012453BB1|nr:peptidoglycan recognition family protein [Robertmurraya sp. DFI.2.37]MDF1510611.1 peptidoglycan recognition family protein [Robertmurraya sp. DFI.2.37]